jgi:hypothetical protein
MKVQVSSKECKGRNKDGMRKKMVFQIVLSLNPTTLSGIIGNSLEVYKSIRDYWDKLLFIPYTCM